MAKKYIIIATCLFVSLLFGLFIFLLIPRSYVVFKVAPENINILIDNKDKKNITNGDSVTLSPGKHKIVIFQDEFKPYETTVNLENGKTIDIITVLKPLTKRAEKLIENDKSQSVVESASGQEMDKVADILNKKYPILKVLPIQARLYTVTACPSVKYPDDQTKMALCVECTQEGLEPYVLKDIEWRGYKSDDYEIIWTVNPSPEE